MACALADIDQQWKTALLKGCPAGPERKSPRLLISDVAAAYPSATGPQVQRAFGELGIFPYLSDWVTSFMGERHGVISIPGCETTLHLPHGAGLPQGSPISPVVFGLLMAAALHASDKKTPPEVIQEVQLYNYVDDMAWAGRYFSSIRTSYLTVKDSLTEYGLTLEPDKTEWISFNKPHWKNKRENTHLSSLAGKLAILDANLNPILPARKLRWLGLIFDEYLRWDHQRASRLSLAHWRLAQIRRLMKRRGLGVKMASKMVQTICIPTLFYGFSCIFQKKARGQKGWVDEWDNFIQKGGRAATGLLTATKLTALYSESGIPHAGPLMEKECRTLQLRLATRHGAERAATVKRIADNLGSTLAVQERIVYLPSEKVQWSQEDSDEMGEGPVLFFTDGSYDNCIGGWAVVAEHLSPTSDNPLRRSLDVAAWGAATSCTVYDLELTAIAAAVDYIARSAAHYFPDCPRNYSVYSDSQAAVTRLQHTRAAPGQDISIQSMRRSKTTASTLGHQGQA